MPIPSSPCSYPVALSAPFAGRGTWTFRFFGGCLDGASSEQELELVLRRLDYTKWKVNRTTSVIYCIHAIDSTNLQLLVAYSANPWVGGG